MYQLAERYVRGEGVALSIGNATELCEALVECRQGMREEWHLAMALLANVLEKGAGEVLPDPVRAMAMMQALHEFEWSRGDPGKWGIRVARMYLRGWAAAREGASSKVEANRDAAIELLEGMEVCGHASATFMLGELYEGVCKKNALEKYATTLRLDAGHSGAMAKLAQLSMGAEAMK